MSLLNLHKVTKIYSDRCILKNITLSVKKGEVYALIGPSGAGKSTLLRIIDLLEKPSSGEVVFEGVRTSLLNENSIIQLRRRMALLSQRVVLFNMSVFGNVAYGLNLRKIDYKIVKEKVNDVLQRVGMLEYADQNALLLSGGEAQRVALARCIVLEPELLLLDEPTANLDPANVALIENIISELNTKNKTTIIIATHNMLQAKRLGSRVGFILNGELVEEGPPSRVFDNPIDERTKAFIDGTMIY